MSIHLSLLRARQGQIKSHTYLFAFEFVSLSVIYSKVKALTSTLLAPKYSCLLSKTHVGQLLLKAPQ